MTVEFGETGSCTVELLDSVQGNPVQSWRFDDCSRVTIGRASSNDITIIDPQVSRLHVELVYREGAWGLRSLGRNGTQINGSRAEEGQLSDRTVFQLGVTGPRFRFMTVNLSVSNLATVEEADTDSLDFLNIDEERKQREVEQITGSETFRMLQESARRLRESNE